MNFDTAFMKLIDVEKGFVNNSNDRGGPTKYGVTIKTLSAWRGYQCSIDDVKNLALAESKAIYKAWYWDKVGGDIIKDYKVAYTLFDQAVNRGVVPVIKAVQKVLNQAVDGVLGPATLNALNMANPQTFIAQFLNDAKIFYVTLADSDPTQAGFKKGWLNRIQLISDYVGVKPATAVGSVAGILVFGVLIFLFLNSSKTRLA